MLLTLLISEPILTEVADVLGRPEVLRKLSMTPIEAAALVELLRRQSTRVTSTVHITRSRDPDDDKFLGCATTSAAPTPTSSRSVRVESREDAEAFYYLHNPGQVLLDARVAVDTICNQAERWGRRTQCE